MDSLLGSQALDVFCCWLYSRRAPLEVTGWLSGQVGPLTLEVQRLLLDLLSSDPLLSAAPIEHHLKLKLYKHVIHMAERSHQELCDELVEEYTCLLQCQAELAPEGAPIVPGWCIKTFCYAHVLPGQTMIEALGQRRVAEHAARLTSCLGHTTSGHATQQPASMPEPATGPGMTVQQEQLATALQCNQSPVCVNYEAGPGPGLLSLRVSGNMLEGGTGCVEWEAGLVLAELLLNQPSLVQGLCCLEVGTGPGTVGIAAARAGARHLLLTDGDAASAANCAFDCALNGVAVGNAEWRAQGGQLKGAFSDEDDNKVQIGVMDWAMWCDEGGSSQLEETPDVILGADLLYDPEIIPTFVRLMRRLLGGRRQCSLPAPSKGAACESHCAPLVPPVAYIATTLRNDTTMAKFIKHATSSGLHLTNVLCPHASPSQPVLEPVAEEGKDCLRFLHVPWLEAARPRVVIHAIRLTADITDLHPVS